MNVAFFLLPPVDDVVELYSAGGYPTSPASGHALVAMMGCAMHIGMTMGLMKEELGCHGV